MKQDTRPLARPFSIIETKASVLEDQEKEAQSLREELRRKKVMLINLMASPGAGKTTLLVRTIRALDGRYRIGVIEADADSDVDSRTIADTGTDVVQVHTGGSCHMDAGMTRRGLEQLPLDRLDIVFLENIGNLVCPAEFDVGAALRVMILSTPEGHDKPLKYPLMFQVSDCVLVNKMDVAAVFDFDLEQMKRNTALRNPSVPVLPVSARNGDGFDMWISWLEKEIERERETADESN